MAILSSILSVTEPHGFWITIIKAFEGVTKNYVLAIIFLTVVIKLITGLIVDTFSKYNSQNMSVLQAKAAPAIEKIKEKYASQPQVMQQKQNEVYRKYYGKSYYAGCFMTMIVMVLNLVIFFTLFSGLNTMSAYKIAQNYDNLKYTYTNSLNVVDSYLNNGQESQEDKLAYLRDYENISFVLGEDGEGNKTISMVYKDKNSEDIEKILATEIYKVDFSSTIEVPPTEEGGEATTKKITNNENIIKLIEEYFPVYAEGEEEGSKEIIIDYERVPNGEGEEEVKPIYLSTVLNKLLTKEVVKVYDMNKESFLWIKNIWIADSPLNKSIVSFNSLKSQVGKNKFEDKEEVIYNAFMPELKAERNQTNGYFILSILCIAVSFLTMFLTKFYNKRKNQKKGLPTTPQAQGKWAQIVVPIIMGVFALFYNSVFAIYMLTSQIVSCVLLYPQLMFVDYLIDKKKDKKDKDTPEVEYSRKF